MLHLVNARIGHVDRVDVVDMVDMVDGVDVVDNVAQAHLAPKQSPYLLSFVQFTLMGLMHCIAFYFNSLHLP